MARDRRGIMVELFGEDSELDDCSRASDEHIEIGEEEVAQETGHEEVAQENHEEINLQYEEDAGARNGVLGDEGARNEEFVDEGPQTGMEFESREALLAAYRAHAKHKGFSVAIRNCRAGYVIIACDRGRKAKVQKSTKRIECPARVNAIENPNGTWRVSTVDANHNHDLEPRNVIFMPGHRSLSINVKRQLEANDIAGLRTCKSVRILEVQAGGPENLGWLGKDCRNYIEQRRRLRLGEGDAEAIRKLFMRLQQKDRSFFYLMDIDDRDSTLRNVMWIHPRSRSAYEEFHDVISFDTTYLVNQYNMPFATVVGVNHHHQSILLGCALLSHEDALSFKWFFSNWLEAMGGVQLVAMLTDQCDSIRIAVRELMPDTVHRLCMWHIMSKTAQKFAGVAEFDRVVSEFNALVYNSLTITEFETGWAEFTASHGLKNNRWLRDLYSERENWIPVYLNHVFWAGMVSTQRSESMHSFFDGYIHSKSTLKQFVEQYEIAVCHKIRKEMRADYDSKCRPRKCISNFKWEEQLRNVYTNNIFELFQAEIRVMWNCNIKNDPVKIGGVEFYEVFKSAMLNNWYHREFSFTVECRPVGQYIACNCRKFESKGILCSHILKVLAAKDIRSVNERYILRRWRKDVYRRHASIFFAGRYPHMSKEYLMFQDVEREFQECTDAAYEDSEKMKFIKLRLQSLKDEIHNWTPVIGNVGASSHTVEGDSSTPVLDPRHINRKGRPKESRYKSAAEKASNSKAKNKKKTASGSGTRRKRTNNIASGSGLGTQT